MPFAAAGIDLDDFLKTGPRLPDEEKLRVAGFLNQYVAVEIETGNQVNVVLTAQMPEGDKLPVIFDNCVVAPESGEPGNWSWILAKIQLLRNLKNRIFRDTLTEKCLNLFQQP